jgi:lysophospholipid acyltransferase (LPLAT)-like uncharacterized protein
MGWFRNIVNKIPYLDGLRLSTLSTICEHGMHFFGNSYSTTKVVAKGARKYIDGDEPAVFAVCHGRLVGLLHIMRDRSKLSILISQSRDGEIATRSLMAVGFRITRGSSARGAVQGALQTIKAAKTRQYPIVVIDGPRGPRQEAKAGAVKMSQLTGYPIIPFTCNTKQRLFGWGWDRFLTPPWGTEQVLFYGEPMFVPESATAEELEYLRQALETNIKALDRKAKAYFAA